MMANKISDQDVLKLFENLKNAEASYPQDMIKLRREKFALQASAMGLLIKAGANGAASTGASQGAATSSAISSSTTGLGASISTVLETALVIAIVVEAAVAAYAYRNKISEFFNPTSSPEIKQVANPTKVFSPDTHAGDETPTEPPVSTSTAIPTTTITLTATPPGFINSNLPVDNNTNTQVSSTSAPTNDNNGLHLGQTKEPTNQPENNNKNEINDKKK